MESDGQRFFISKIGFLPETDQDIDRRILNGNASLVDVATESLSALTSGKYGKGIYTNCDVCPMGTKCNGHTNYLQFNYPIPKPVFIGNILKMLENYCASCKVLNKKSSSKKCTCVFKTRKIVFRGAMFTW